MKKNDIDMNSTDTLKTLREVVDKLLLAGMINEEYHAGFVNSFDIIEDALKEAKMEHILRIRLENINFAYQAIMQVIFEKEVDFSQLIDCATEKQYNDTWGDDKYKLGKSDFDFLKALIRVKGDIRSVYGNK